MSTDIDSGTIPPPTNIYPQGNGWEFQFSGWSSSTGGGGSGLECPECSIYRPVSIASGWTAGDKISLGAISLGTISLYNRSNCVSVMALENVSINDGRPYNALEMIAQLRAFSINSCGEIDAIGPQEEKYFDLDCPPCTSLGYDDLYSDTHQVSLGDARCISFDQMVDISLGVDYDCPSSLKILYKTRAVELNACGEIDSISPVTTHEKSVDLEDQSYFTGSVDFVTDTKQELDNDGGVSSSLNCSTDEHYGSGGNSHSHDFTLSVTTTTFTLTTFVKTKTLTFDCGRLELVSAESGWISKGSESWTSQSISCSGGGGGNGGNGGDDECECDPGYSTIWLYLYEPDNLDPLNGTGTYTSIEMTWLGYPDCYYEAADGSGYTLSWDSTANGGSGAWILSLTPSHTAGNWDQNVVCDPFIGGFFYDQDDANGLTYVEIYDHDPEDPP